MDKTKLDFNTVVHILENIIIFCESEIFKQWLQWWYVTNCTFHFLSKISVVVFKCSCILTSELYQWRTQKIFIGGVLVQGHMVVICIWCAIFVTSQFDIISMFLHQHFGEVCWHNMHIFLHPLPYFMCHCTGSKLLSELRVRLSEINKLNATTHSS